MRLLLLVIQKRTVLDSFAGRERETSDQCGIRATKQLEIRAFMEQSYGRRAI